MKQGYLALHRKIQNHPFYKEKRVFSKYEAWVDILMEVQHSIEPKDVLIGMDVMKCQYGESLKSIKTWSKRWNWTESKVRRYFSLLKKMNQIRTKNEVKTTRLFVINYESYDPKRRTNDEQTTSKRSAGDEQATTDNNVKKEKNVKNVNKYVFPENYSEKLKESFLDFIQNRKELKKPVTQRAFSGLVNKLDKLSGGNEHEALEIIENSLINGWAGLFAVKNNKKQTQSRFEGLK